MRQTQPFPTHRPGAKVAVLPVSALILALALALFAGPALATSVQQLNLDEMLERGEFAYRVNVLAVEEGSLSLAGGELPQVTYTFEIVEGFKNAEAGDVVQMSMVGSLGDGTSRDGDVARFATLPQMPTFEVGAEYLLITTAASAIGLSSPVGLGQSSFQIVGDGELELAVNSVDNVGLFQGMDVKAASSGAVPYDLLAREIRRSLTHDVPTKGASR